MNKINKMNKIERLLEVIEIEEKEIRIKMNGSEIRITKEGDIILNAKRHIINRRRLYFDGCKEEFIEKTIREYEKGEERFKEHLENETLELELKSKIKQCIQ